MEGGLEISPGEDFRLKKVFTINFKRCPFNRKSANAYEIKVLLKESLSHLFIENRRKFADNFRSILHPELSAY